jgi:hypothetical protein
MTDCERDVVRIAVAGAGLIGKRHIEEVDASDSAVLASIVDPGPAGRELAQIYGVPCYPSLAELFAKDKSDGIILATPNQLHVAGGLECVEAGVPVLVEKPIGDTVASATRLVEAGESARVSVLTGHHRNYSSDPDRGSPRQIRRAALGCPTTPSDGRRHRVSVARQGRERVRSRSARGPEGTASPIPTCTGRE